jgi:hypothetical protein
MDEREELIRKKIVKEDFIEVAQVAGIKEEMRELLIKEKGFSPAEIVLNPVFRIELANFSANVSIDVAVRLNNTYFMIIKCVSGAMESWERYVISFARAAEEYMIPYAAITDGKDIRIFDAISGSLLSESGDRLVNRKEAMEIIRNIKTIGYVGKNLEKEKRIIYAFESIKCTPPEKTK